MINKNFKHLLNSDSKLSPHEVQVSYSYSAPYVIVTMSHTSNSTSLKLLLLFLQNLTRREYEAPSTTGVFCFVLMFKPVYGRPGLWLIDAINFIFPAETTVGIWTKSHGNYRLLKCLYISGKDINKYGRLGLWLSDVLQTSALKLLYWISTKFNRKQVLTKCITSFN